MKPEFLKAIHIECLKCVIIRGCCLSQIKFDFLKIPVADIGSCPIY